jgi:hypothetical protein
MLESAEPMAETRTADLATPPNLHIGWKVYGCTIGTVLLAGVPTVSAVIRGRLPTPTILQALLLFVGFAVVGFCVGLLLSSKDFFDERLAAGYRVGFPFRQIFCSGIWSLMLFWIPAVIAIVLVGLMVAINLQYGV